jgi:hypothetical protein
VARVNKWLKMDQLGRVIRLLPYFPESLSQLSRWEQRTNRQRLKERESKLEVECAQNRSLYTYWCSELTILMRGVTHHNNPWFLDCECPEQCGDRYGTWPTTPTDNEDDSDIYHDDEGDEGDGESSDEDGKISLPPTQPRGINADPRSYPVDRYRHEARCTCSQCPPRTSETKNTFDTCFSGEASPDTLESRQRAADASYLTASLQRQQEDRQAPKAGKEEAGIPRGEKTKRKRRPSDSSTVPEVGGPNPTVPRGRQYRMQDLPNQGNSAYIVSALRPVTGPTEPAEVSVPSSAPAATVESSCSVADPAQQEEALAPTTAQVASTEPNEVQEGPGETLTVTLSSTNNSSTNNRRNRKASKKNSGTG